MRGDKGQKVFAVKKRYYKRELFIYMLQRGLLKKMTKFNSWERNKGYSEGVQVEEGET